MPLPGCNSDPLGWSIVRARTRGLHRPFASGGFNAGLRDMAHIGQLLLDGGMIGDQRRLPQAAMDSIRAGGDKTAFAKAGYPLLKGWVTAAGGGSTTTSTARSWLVACTGIARFSSHPATSNAANDPTTLPAFAAVADHLGHQPLTRRKRVAFTRAVRPSPAAPRR